MSEKLEEFMPKSGIDWTKIVMSILLAAFTLMMGRVWGESIVSTLVNRNQMRVSVLERRLDDHMQSASAQQQQILSELQAIREVLVAGR